MTQIAIRSKLSKALDSQLKQIKSATDKPFQTSGQFKFNPSSNFAVDIQRLRNVSQLISIGAFLSEKKASYDAYAKAKELSSFPVFKWQDFTFEQWDNDLSVRIAVVSAYDRQKEITNAKAKLERFLTEEDQLQITLRELGLDTVE